MCQEPTLPKYTAQPVRACPGFAPGAGWHRGTGRRHV